MSPDEAEVDVVAWIEGLHKHASPSGGIGYHSAADFERRYDEQQRRAAAGYPRDSRGRAR
jgi:hypothetical protein